jgi:hypothetical protein
VPSGAGRTTATESHAAIERRENLARAQPADEAIDLNASEAGGAQVRSGADAAIRERRDGVGERSECARRRCRARSLRRERSGRKVAGPARSFARGGVRARRSAKRGDGQRRRSWPGAKRRANRTGCPRSGRIGEQSRAVSVSQRPGCRVSAMEPRNAARAASR